MPLTLDHFVVHIDNSPDLLTGLKAELASIDIPFEPDWGKGTKGFKAANIWIGRQYFEIIRILRPDGGGWTPRWVERHRTGQRGLYCLFLATDDLDRTAATLRAAGIALEGPERIAYRASFGLWKKSMPWRVLYLPPVPGTGVEIGFIQYDPDPKDRLKAFMPPNADEKGVTGVTACAIHLPLSESARAFIRQVFPQADIEAGRIAAPLDGGTLHFQDAPEIRADFYAHRPDGALKGSVTLANVTLHA